MEKPQRHQKQDSPLNAKPKTLKVLEENVENMLQDIHRGKGFINRTLVAQEIIQTIDKWDLPKPTAFVQKKQKLSSSEESSLQNERKSSPAIYPTED